MEILEFLSRTWKPCVEIILFWYAYFVLLRFLRSSGGLQILKGIMLIFVFFVLVRFLRLETISLLMAQILPISVIALLVLFQNDIRRGLTRIGQSPMFKLFLKEEKLIDEIVKSISALSKKKIGALIAIEKEMSLKPYAETGVVLDAVVSFELLSTIFIPSTPLHDGGLVIQGSRVQSAGCLFPLSQNPHISKTLGTRHRASLGLTEETDGLVIVVSEETGIVSLAEKGELTRRVSAEELTKRLTTLYSPQKETHRGWWTLWRGERKHDKTQ